MDDAAVPAVEEFTPEEIAERDELHQTLRRARIKARKVMRAFWWHTEITDAYMHLVSELSFIDPLFGKDYESEIYQDRHTMNMEKRPLVGTGEVKGDVNS